MLSEKSSKTVYREYDCDFVIGKERKCVIHSYVGREKRLDINTVMYKYSRYKYSNTEL